MRRIAVLFMVFAWSIEALSGQAPMKDEAAGKSLRICTIGASVSAGFGSNYNLAEVLRAALGTSAEVIHRADAGFFFSVEQKGKEQITKAIDVKADVVIGIDFLFWYAAGEKSLEKRLADIDAAFAELDRIESTVLIGRIPHMRRVSKRMLPESRQIPPSQLPEINARIDKNVQARTNMRIVPVDLWMDAIEDGKKLDAFERMEAEVVDRTKYLLPDGLHLSRDGIIFAAGLLIDDLRGDVLVGLQYKSTLKEITQALEASERRLIIDVFDQDSEPVNEGLIRFDLPDIGELASAGFSLEELSKLSELNRYSKPLAFNGSNRVEIKGIPAAAARVKLRLRAEIGDEAISSWTDIQLDRVEKRTILIARPAQELRVKVLAGPNANALAGALVTTQDEVDGRQLRLKRLKGDGPGYATTDAEGIALLRGLGPDSKTFLIRGPDGKNHEIERPAGEGLLLLRLPVPEAAPEPEEKESGALLR